MSLRGRASLTEETLFFVTSTVVRFLNVFTDPNACDILISNIKYYQTIYKFEILAYVIMPSHFHWIVFVNPKYGTISDIMRDIKRNSSKELMQYLKENESFLKLFKKEAAIYRDQYKKFWMKRFDDKVIRNNKMLRRIIHYIHENPIKKELADKPENYRYSSARNYMNGDHSVLNVQIAYLNFPRAPR